MTWNNHPIWEKWGQLTAYYNALEVACDWHSALWKLVPIEGVDATTVLRKKGMSEFRKSTGEFRVLLDDRSPLASMLFLSSFALFESFCVDGFEALASVGKVQKREDYLVGGIEAWSDVLLKAAGRTWKAVQPGREGILEAAIVRNSYAHGSKTFHKRDVSRFTQLNLKCPFSAGDSIPDTPLALLERRHRLNYFLTILQQGLNKHVAWKR